MVVKDGEVMVASTQGQKPGRPGLGGVAFGGGAAGYYACGGGALGRHVIWAGERDPEAEAFFARYGLDRVCLPQRRKAGR